MQRWRFLLILLAALLGAYVGMLFGAYDRTYVQQAVGLFLGGSLGTIGSWWLLRRRPADRR